MGLCSCPPQTSGSQSCLWEISAAGEESLRHRNVRPDVEVERLLRLGNVDINHGHEERHACIVDQDVEAGQFADAGCDRGF